MKLLVDKFNRTHNYLRISVTDKCNLRCNYCLPNEDIIWKTKSELLNFDEILRIVNVGAKLGITKIRLTGGEPLIRNNIEYLIKEIHNTSGIEKVSITTNGILLANRIDSIQNSINSINLSLDTFNKQKFFSITNRDFFDETINGINSALESTIKIVKLNCVVIKGLNDNEILDFVDFAFNNKIQVRFIEFMPFASNSWSLDKCLTMEEIIFEISKKYDLILMEKEPNYVSNDFKIVCKNTKETGLGSLGIIASNSQPFCSVCSRLRLTAEGMLMSCLHSPQEFDLKSALRNGSSDSDLENIFFNAIDSKQKEHLQVEELNLNTNRIMIQIGG